MKNIYLSILTVLTLASVSFAQVSKVEKNLNDVTGSTFEPKLTSTFYEVRWVGDGRNIRGAFNIGEGFALDSVVSNLPKVFANSRVVPFVTVDASSNGAAPRSTVAVILPELSLSRSLSLQFGAVLRGYDFNSSRSVNGVDPYVKVGLSFEELKKSLDKLWKF